MKTIERFAKFRAVPQDSSDASVTSSEVAYAGFFGIRPEPMIDVSDPIAREPRAYPTSPERMDRAAKPLVIVEDLPREEEIAPLRWLELRAQAGSHQAPQVVHSEQFATEIDVQEPLPESAYMALRAASVSVQRSTLSPAQRAARRDRSSVRDMR